MLGLFIWLIYVKKSDVRYLAVASLVLGLATVAKTPDAVVFIPLAMFELYKRRFTNLMVALGAFAIILVIFYGYFYMQSGTLSFYGGDRLVYTNNFPLWGGYDSVNEAGAQAFSINSGDTISALINTNNLKIIPYNLFYYFFGRFTGMLWYYPFAALALISFLYQCRNVSYVKEHPEKLCILGAIALYIFTYAVLIGDNYFGGGWAVGNRYFYIYPAFIFLLDKVDPKKLAVFLAIALITILPLVSDPIGVSTNINTHTTQFPFTYFPLELSQLGNLPMWGQSLQDGYGNSFTVYQAHAEIYNGTLMVAQSDILLLSGKPIQHLDLSLYSDFSYNNGTVTSNGFVEKVHLLDMELKRVKLTDLKPIYSDSRQYVYEVNVAFE